MIKAYIMDEESIRRAYSGLLMKSLNIMKI